MPAPVFPSLRIAPGYVLAQPKHPYAAARSTAGRETRIRLSNVKVRSRFSFKISNVYTANLLLLLNHWNSARGTARPFSLQATSLGIMQSAGRTQVLSTQWKYASRPKCVDLVDGFQSDGITPRLIHTISIELKSSEGSLT